MKSILASIVCSVAVLLCSCGSSTGTTDIYRPYVDTTIAGYTVHVDKQLWDTQHGLTEHALTTIERELGKAISLLPSDAVTKIGSVPIWLEAKTPNGSPVQYHFSADWLSENGYHPKKEASIEIVAKDYVKLAAANASLLSQLSAAYLQRVVGFTNQSVLAAFGNAVTLKRTRATNARDYFVFTSAVYFSEIQGNQALRELYKSEDSLSYEMLRSTWNL